MVGAARALRVLAQGRQLARRHHAEKVERTPRPWVDGGVERDERVLAPAARHRVQVGARVGGALDTVLAEPVAPTVRRRNVKHVCGEGGGSNTYVGEGSNTSVGWEGRGVKHICGGRVKHVCGEEGRGSNMSMWGVGIKHISGVGGRH